MPFSRLHPSEFMKTVYQKLCFTSVWIYTKIRLGVQHPSPLESGVRFIFRLASGVRFIFRLESGVRFAHRICEMYMLFMSLYFRNISIKLKMRCGDTMHHCFALCTWNSIRGGSRISGSRAVYFRRRRGLWEVDFLLILFICNISHYKWFKTYFSANKI